MLSKGRNVLWASQVPKLNFCVLTPCYQKAIIIRSGECSHIFKVALQLDYFTLMLEIPYVYSAASSSREKLLLIIRKRKACSVSFLAGESEFGLFCLNPPKSQIALVVSCCQKVGKSWHNFCACKCCSTTDLVVPLPLQLLFFTHLLI